MVFCSDAIILSSNLHKRTCREIFLTDKIMLASFCNLLLDLVFLTKYMF